ncbi:unnamed protein product [Lathyrus sativus]|nr:unnamed protein product [Lathyrus sativus]
MVASASEKQAEQVIVKVMVDKEKSKVLFAEAGKSFVDVLFSFLALPLGTIARMVSEKTNIEAVRFGCLSSLYESVSDLDEQYLASHACKERLLKPDNSMKPYWQQIKYLLVELT